MSDYSWIGPLISGIGKGVNSFAGAGKASGQMDDAYRQMLANLQERFGDYDKLGDAGYKDIIPVLLGDSALGGIPKDVEGRQAQQEAMAALSELQQNGGMTLGDQKALNDIEANLNRNDSARRKGLANEFAARGQLGSGAQLAMALQGQSDAAMGANQRAESVAAQAQARALNAILQKGQMGRQMGNDQYGRDAEAARARDAIEARNAAARMGAQTANNAIAGQRFDDNLAKARGKTQLTGDINKGIFGRSQNSADLTNAQTGYTNKLIDQGGTMWDRFGGSGGSTQGNTTVNDNAQTDADLLEEEEVEAGGDD